VNPEPAATIELTVTEAVPADVKVTDCVVGVFSITLPNAKLVALMVSVGTTAVNCKAKFSETLPAVAVSVTACAELTVDTVAVNPALVALAGTDTVAGTVTATLLLDRLTLSPLLDAAALNVTVQASVPAPVMDALLQESELSAAAGVTGALAAEDPQPERARGRPQHNTTSKAIHEPLRRRI
jgi:hypothetical protein